MKKYILYILVGIASWGLASCNGFLDVDQYFNDLYQLDSVFTKRSTTEQWLWKVYSRLDANREICNKMVVASILPPMICFMATGPLPFHVSLIRIVSIVLPKC